MNDLPEGVRIADLTMNHDHRGCLTELFREEWDVGTELVQWNFVRSAAGVLRGMHVHPRHWDYFTLIDGVMHLGLYDLRTGSPTENASSMTIFSGEQLRAISIPPGVAHGFFYPQNSSHVYAVSHYWDTDDELACAWDDPELGFNWPVSDPILSPRDKNAGSLAELRRSWSRAVTAGDL